tara:strand:+ start:19860 stop:20045 length:186 start_codon:yes stop_codon:yes gene_type:complete
MNFHIADGEDYYSEQPANDFRFKIILEAINQFNHEEFDIKDARVQEMLAKKISDDLKLYFS